MTRIGSQIDRNDVTCPRTRMASRGRLSLAIALACATAAVVIPSTLHAQLTGQLGAHDPSTLTKLGTRYYYYATGQGISIRTSADRIAWSGGGSVFASAPAWTTAAVPGFTGNFWAPDISYRNGRYYLYYSVSTFGSRVSAIGVASTTTLDPAAPGFGWTDHGPVIQSSAATSYNAIDPGIFHDTNGRSWMTFGSYFGGIYLTELDPTTGKRLSESTAPTRIAQNSSIEAPALIKRGDYYYLFVNHGTCCSGINSTYDIRVGRSTSVTGPFLDKSGVNMASGGGTLFLDDEGNKIGPGHFSLYSENGQDSFGYHYYDGNRNGAATYDWRNLYWTSDAWPSAAVVNPTWGGNVSGNWSSAPNWSAGGVPDGVGHAANFGSNVNGRYTVAVDVAGRTLGTINFTGTAGYTIGSAGGNGITLDAVAGTAATINASAGSHTIAAPITTADPLGINVTPASSTLTLGGPVSGTSLTKYGFGTLALGGANGYGGTVLLKNGTTRITGAVTAAGFTSVGHAGGETATMIVQGNGSFVSTGDLNIGDTGDTNLAATGTVELRDSASITVNATGGFFVGSGITANRQAVGTVNQTGGTLTAHGGFDGAFVVGGRTSSVAVGTYNLGGGIVHANTNVRIGGRGTGTVLQTGGTFNANGYVAIGRFAGSTGTWTINAGTLNVTNASTLLIVGESGSGTLTLGGSGQVVSAAPLRLGHAGGGGTVHLNGGVLGVPRVDRGTGTASFTFNGGTLRAMADHADFFQFGAAESEIATGGARIDTDGHAVTITRSLDGIGGLTKRGAGTLTFTSGQAFTGGVAVEAGTLRMPRLSGNGSVVLSGGELVLATPATPFDPANRSTTPSLAITGGRLDLGQNLFVIDYVAGNLAPLAAVRAALATGRLINSAVGTTYAVGYADAATLAAIPAAFAGVDPTSLLIRATLKGDADLDTVVDFADLLALAQNYGIAGGAPRTWQQGDFDYTGVVDFADLLALAQNYGGQAASALAAVAAADQQAFAADWALAQSLVPEPGALVALVLVAAASPCRRRRG